MSVGAVAQLLGITDRRVQQLVKEGWIEEPATHGKYSVVDAVQGYVRFLKSDKRDNTRGAETSRLASAQADRVEMENLRRMGELQTTAQVMDTCHGLVVMMKSGHSGLPGRLASEFAAITEPTRIHRRLQDELRAVESICADFLEQRASTLESMPDPRRLPAAETSRNAEPMGGSEPGDAS